MLKPPPIPTFGGRKKPPLKEFFVVYHEKKASHLRISCYKIYEFGGNREIKRVLIEIFCVIEKRSDLTFSNKICTRITLMRAWVEDCNMNMLVTIN